MIKRILAILAAPVLAFSQGATNDYILYQKPAAGPLVVRPVTPTVGKLIGWPSSINTPTAITIGSGLSLSSLGVLTGSGGGTWGSITGTLSAQTDLNAALIGKQPLNEKLTALSSLTTSGAGVMKYTTDFGFTASQINPADMWNPLGVNTIMSFNGSGNGAAITPSVLLDLIGSTQGQILYRGASGWTVLSPGTSGQALTTGGSGANPSWATVSGGVSDGDKGSLTVSGGTWTIDAGAVTDSMLAGSITPSKVTGTAAILGANTYTGAQTLTGVPVTGDDTTALPLVNIRPSSGVTAVTTQNANGTAIGVTLQDASQADFIAFYRSNTPLGRIGFNARFSGMEMVNAGVSGFQIYSSQANAQNENNTGRTGLFGDVATGLRMASGYQVGWSANAAGVGDVYTLDTQLVRAAAGIVGLRDGSTGGASFEFTEQTAPAGAANKARIFAEDNGSGSTRLMAAFGTGAAQQIAIEGGGGGGGGGPVNLATDVTGTLPIANGGTGATSLSNLITLSTHTTGNYVSDVAGTSGEITSTHTPGEGSTATISLPAAIDLGGKTSFEIPNSAAPTVDATGELALDTTITDFKPSLVFFDGTDERIAVSIKKSALTATDNYVIDYDAATDEFVMSAGGGGSFDPASPGTIGGTTPGIGYFSVLSYLPTYWGDLTWQVFSAVNSNWVAGLRGNTGVTLGSYGGNDLFAFICDATPRAVFGTDASPAYLAFCPLSAGPTLATSRAAIYSKDVSSSAELFVKDESGNETQISPHARNAPDSLVDSAFDEIGYSANYYTGLVTWTNRDRETKGKRNVRLIETFAEYNARLNTTGDAVLVQRDWTADKAAEVAKRDAEIDAWTARKAAWEADAKSAGKPFVDEEPKLLVAKPQPAWITEQLAVRSQLIADRDAAIAAEPAERTERQQIRATMDALKAGTGTQGERIARIEKALHRLLKDSLQ